MGRLRGGSAKCRIGSKLQGQQGLEVVDGPGPGKIGEDFAQIRVGFETIGLTGFDQAAQVGRGLDAPGTVTEHPVAPSDAEGTDRIFGGIIIYRQPPVCQIDEEPVPFVGQIREGPAQGALGRDPGAVDIEPGMQPVSRGPGMLVAIPMAVFGHHVP